MKGNRTKLASVPSRPVTVLMPVSDAEAYLGEAIESVLSQSFCNFHLLIIDDASMDRSWEVINSFSDPRIVSLRLAKKVGMAKTLNRGLDLVKTPLVARMDADDVCLQYRLERQLSFMEQNPDVGISGSFAATFGNDSWVIRHPEGPSQVRVQLLFEAALAHPTVIMRTGLLNQFQLRYDEEMGLSEDWELWKRAAEFFDLANLPEVLLRYRLHGSSLSAQNIEKQKAVDRGLHARFLCPLGLSDHPLRWVHSDVSMSTLNIMERGEKFLIQVNEWFDILQERNLRAGVYNPEALSRCLNRRLLLVLQFNAADRWKALRLFYMKRLYVTCPPRDSLAFLLKCLPGMSLKRSSEGCS